MPSPTLNAYWYIDLENVGVRFASLFPFMKAGDHVLVFYSGQRDFTVFSTYDKMLKLGLRPHFIQTEQYGKNAMDFAIMVEMGRNSVLYPDVSHNCVTYDKGFLAGVRQLNSHGVQSDMVPPRSK